MQRNIWSECVDNFCHSQHLRQGLVTFLKALLKFNKILWDECRNYFVRFFPCDKLLVSPSEKVTALLDVVGSSSPVLIFFLLKHFVLNMIFFLKHIVHGIWEGIADVQKTKCKINCGEKKLSMKLKLILRIGFPGCVKCQQGQKLENYFRVMSGRCYFPSHGVHKRFRHVMLSRGIRRRILGQPTVRISEVQNPVLLWSALILCT